MQRYDAIVVGVGGMGSAAVFQLARRGATVLGLERFSIPHDMGSSHGVSRIIRFSYWEDPSYVPLLRRAYQLWRDVENTTGERLLVITGMISAGAEDSQVVRGVRLSLDTHHLPYDLLDPGSLRRRFPAFHLPEDMVAVYQPDGGFVLSERAIVTHVTLAQALGAEVHAHERALEWQPTDRGVTVRTTRGEYACGKLVITAGPWIGEMVPELERQAVPERQVLLWAQPLRPEHFRLGALPVFSLQVPEGRFYGMPVYGVPGFKIGKYHHLHQRVRPDEMDREVHAEDEAVLREGIRRYLPDGNGPAMAMKTCLFTNTLDGHFIIDHHPASGRVYVAAGFSGHGFKFASVMGEIMADLALEGASPFDLRLFRWQRLSPDEA